MADDRTIWLTKARIAELYQTSIPNINMHIRTIFNDEECFPASIIKEYLIVRIERSRKVEHSIENYNLDMILAIGYRVRTYRGIQFCRWAPNN